MNIKLKNEIQFKALSNATKVTILVGSHLYQMSNEKSDMDILNITGNFMENQNSFLWEHHQFQYQKNDTDYLFTSLNNFLRNTLTGDSTINFESLYTPSMYMSSLAFLYEKRDQFITYNLIRSYLGLAKRDLKLYKKKKESYKLFHFVRGIEVADLLLNQRHYSNNLNEFSFKDLLLAIKNEQISNANISGILKEYEQKMNHLRSDLNEHFEKGLISKTLSPTNLMLLDQEVRAWNKTNVVPGKFIDDQQYHCLLGDIAYDE